MNKFVDMQIILCHLICDQYFSQTHFEQGTLVSALSKWRMVFTMYPSLVTLLLVEESQGSVSLTSWMAVGTLPLKLTILRPILPLTALQYLMLWNIELMFMMYSLMEQFRKMQQQLLLLFQYPLRHLHFIHRVQVYGQFCSSTPTINVQLFGFLYITMLIRCAVINSHCQHW